MNTIISPSKLNPYKFLRNTGIATLIAAGSIAGANLSTKDYKENFIPTAEVAGTLATLGLGATVAGVAGQKRKDELNKVFEIPIKELSDEEFEDMQKVILKKREKLNYYNNSIIDTSFKINKYNIQVLNKVIESNDDFWELYKTIRSIDNIYSAKFFDYLYINKNKVPKTVCDLLNRDVVEHIENETELETKINLIDEAIKNPEFGNNSFVKEIIEYSKNKKDTDYLKDFTQKYGLTPAYKDELLNKFDEKVLNKMLEQVNDIQEKYNLNLDHLSQTDYKINTDLVYFTTRNKINFLFDKNGNLLSFEKDNTIHNLTNNTSYKITPKKIKIAKDAVFDRENLCSADFEEVNSNNESVKKSFYQSKIKGEFEFEEISSKNKYKLALAEFDKKGGKHIEKHFTSLDGTTTDYVYACDKKGNYYFYQKITDKDKKVLFENEKKFKVLGDNHFLSTTNGIEYDIKFDSEKIAIKNLNTNEEIEYKIKKYSQDNYQSIGISISLDLQDKKLRPQLLKRTLFIGDLLLERGLIEKYTVDKKIVKQLKYLSGDEWFNAYKAQVYAINSTINTSHSVGKIIEMDNDDNNLAAFEHELGHEKSNYLRLFDDKELKRIYQEEKLQLTTNLPELVVNQPAYFLRDGSRGLAETMAEANLVINTTQEFKDFGSRTFFFQQYFPRTIAYIGNKFKEMSNN